VSDLTYLYGFVPTDASPPNLMGIGGRPVSLVDVGGVFAAISHVPADIYAAERVEPRLQDLGWVAEQGVAHETVVAWFVDHSEILPVSLFTLYSGDAALRAAVSPRAAQLAAELDRLNNKREWDLKISFDEREAERYAASLSPRIAELEREAAQATPGKRYLIEKQRADLLKTETRTAAHTLAQTALDAAGPFTQEVLTLPIPRTDELPVILHAALLVERSVEVELVAMLEQQTRRLASKGLALAFSGPWAPYRFTGENERTAAGV
jgi:hypothetical protein